MSNKLSDIIFRMEVFESRFTQVKNMCKDFSGL